MIMTVNEFMDKVTSLKDGETMVYYTGNLAMMRGPKDSHGPLSNLANLAYRLAVGSNQLGYLTQRISLTGKGHDYLFTKKRSKV